MRLTTAVKQLAIMSAGSFDSLLRENIFNQVSYASFLNNIVVKLYSFILLKED
jgi:hypothetical protein